MHTILVTLGFDGVVALPPDLRRQLDWASGDTLRIECDGDSLLIRRDGADADDDTR